jgi:hypothetical protein
MTVSMSDITNATPGLIVRDRNTYTPPDRGKTTDQQ